MKGSSCFGSGFGIKKIKKILEIYPNVLELDNDLNLFEKINNIDGFSDKTTKKFIEGLNHVVS